MSVKVISWVWDHSVSKGAERLVLLAIADHAHDDGMDAYPSVKTIARKANLDERSVQRAIQRLMEMGELSVTLNAGKGGSNLYRVLMTPGVLPPPRQDATPGNTPPPRQSATPAERHPSPGNTPPPPRHSATRTVLEPSLNRPTTPAAPRLTDIDGKFDQFWAIYPRREAKAGAKAKFVTALRRGVELETILAGARRYRDDPNREPQFTKHPTTWLNNGCWDDEPLPVRDQANPRASAAPNRPQW